MATEIEELLVKLEADTKEYINRISVATKDTAKASNRMTKQFKSLSDNTKKSTSIMNSALGTMAGFVGGAVVIGAFNRLQQASRALFDTFIVDGIKAAQKQEDAIEALNTSLRLAGTFSTEASERFQGLAKELQRTTRFGDETTLRFAALARNFTRSNEEAERLTAAAIDLSAATGLSLDSSVKNLGKTFAGLTGELGESVPIIRTLTAEQLKAGAAIDLIAQRFGGAAAQAAMTFSGQVEQLKNNFGDLQENIGLIITQNEAWISIMHSLNQIIIDTNEGIEDQNDALKLLAGEGIIAVTRGLADILEAFNLLAESKGLRFDIDSEGIKISLDGVEDAANTTLGKLTTRLREASDAAEHDLSLMAQGFTALEEPAQNAKRVIEEVTEAQKTMGEEGKILAEEALIAAQEDSEARDIILMERLANEQAQIQAALDQKLISEQTFLAAQDALRQKFVDIDKARQEKRRKQELQRDQMRMAAASKFFGGFAALARQGGRKTFQISKRLAQAQALVDGFAAVQRALANPPGPPFNAAIVAGTAALTIANIASIERQTFARGGEIPGTGFKDSVPILAMPNETVIDRRTTSDIKDFFGNLRQLTNRNQAAAQFSEGEGTGQNVVVTIEFAGDAAQMLTARQRQDDVLGINVV